MSVNIGYFFNYPKSLPELVEEINECLGCSLAPYENDPEDFFDRFLSMEFSLRTAKDYSSDGDLGLGKFKYLLDFRTPWRGAEARPIQLPAMLMTIYALHRWLGITGLLVFDVQILFARYEERDLPDYGRRLYNVLSGTAFISFPAHLKILKKRLPEYWQAFYADEPLS